MSHIPRGKDHAPRKFQIFLSLASFEAFVSQNHQVFRNSAIEFSNAILRIVARAKGTMGTSEVLRRVEAICRVPQKHVPLMKRARFEGEP